MSQCVLVVDDDREIVRAISLLLEREGYTVLKAYDRIRRSGTGDGQPGSAFDCGYYDAQAGRFVGSDED